MKDMIFQLIDLSVKMQVQIGLENLGPDSIGKYRVEILPKNPFENPPKHPLEYTVKMVSYQYWIPNLILHIGHMGRHK